MDTIKDKLRPENYSENNLVQCLTIYPSFTPAENFYFWNMVLKILNEDNVVTIMGFVFDLQENIIVFPRYAQKSLNFHIHQINKRVAKLVPRDIAFYVKNLRLLKFSKEEGVSELSQNMFDCQEYLINVLYELLIRTSTVELGNLIDKHFNIKRAPVEFDESKRLLGLLSKIDETSTLLYNKYLCCTLDNPITVLEYVYRNSDEANNKLLFECIYLLNTNLYNDILQVIYDNGKYQKVDLIKLLPEINIDMFVWDDAHCELLKFLLRSKPIYKYSLIDILCKNFSRKNIVQIYADNLDILGDTHIDLSFDELLDLSSCNPKFLHRAKPFIETEQQLELFYSKFKDVDEDEIVDYLKVNKDDELVSYILSNRQLKDKLRVYILEHYKTNHNIVCKLLVYMGKDEAIEYIPSHLVDADSLAYFLLVLSPSEILTSALNLRDIKLSIKVIDLCVDSSEFQEDDFFTALNSVKHSMPPLVIRTLILNYKRFPHTKDFTIDYLCDLVDNKALRDEQLRVGIIKCMEMIGSDCVWIVSRMNDEDIRTVVNKSNGIREFCLDALYKKEHRYRRDFDNLRRFLNRR